MYPKGYLAGVVLGFFINRFIFGYRTDLCVFVGAFFLLLGAIFIIFGVI